MKKGRLVIFAVTSSILLAGCTLEKENHYVEPVIIVETDHQITKSYIEGVKTLDELEEIKAYVETLKGDQHVIVYKSYDPDLDAELFEFSLQKNPMIQIYCDGETNFYPNVTYVENLDQVDQKIHDCYSKNQVTGYCIQKLRDIKDFDLEEWFKQVQEKCKDIDREVVKEGLVQFSEYVQNTKVFQKCEDVVQKTSDTLEPYVEKMIPKIESAYQDAKPYLEKGKQKAEEIYKETKPKIVDLYTKAKEKVKK